MDDGEILMGLTIAITPDGNRRWARLHNLPIIKGHETGISKLKDLAEWASELDVDNLLIWIFSTENASRTEEEVKGLFKLFDSTIDRLEEELKKSKDTKGVKLRFIGKKDIFPRELMEKARALEDKTKSGGRTLALLIGYGGRQEIVDAANRLIADAKAGKVSKVDESTFPSYLYAPDMPDPDIVIRTGEKRMSGLLPWQSVYSEIYFVDKLWPDFKKEDFVAVIDDFRNKRQRRFGK